MRAVVLHRYGTPQEALELHTDWAMPERKPHQVLIEAAATSVNAGDW
jgi:NADPH:quinone reductase-like Zn-dependent oxidoreductase